MLIARNEKNLAEYQKNFVAKNIEVDTRTADVTKFDEFVKIFNSLIQKHGTPDVMLYNVEITAPDNKTTLNAQTLVEHYISDVAEVYNCVKLVYTKESAEKSGAIFITGGGLALKPYADYLPLSMDKTALRAMVQALTPILKEKVPRRKAPSHRCCKFFGK